MQPNLLSVAFFHPIYAANSIISLSPMSFREVYSFFKNIEFIVCLFVTPFDLTGQFDLSNPFNNNNRNEACPYLNKTTQTYDNTQKI